MAEQYHLVIIGGGPAGYEAAFFAAKNGRKTALVENRELGGTCLNRGCIPTKTILHSTSLYQELAESEAMGITVKEAAVSLEKIQSRKREVLENLRGGIALRLKKARVSVFQGTGVIEDAHTVKVGEELLTAEHILICTGSSPAVPPVPGLDLPGVMNSDALLENREKIGRLLIIGGGVIGLEFASLYRQLGTEVVIVEMLERILANMDREFSQSLKVSLKKRGVEIHTGARVLAVREGAQGELICRIGEKEAEIDLSADRILVAAGRRANTAGLFAKGAEPAGERGILLVDQYGQTSIPGIYAAGDVTGGIQLAHVAAAEAVNAVCHMLGKAPKKNMVAVPSCVYTSPEIASVGMTADEAKAGNVAVRTAKYPMSANGKTLLSGGERGFIKVVAEKETGKILGAQLMCERATDLIAVFTEAIVNGLTVGQMSEAIFAHPTFSEGIGEVLELLTDEA